MDWDEEFEEFRREDRRKDLKRAYGILNEMMHSFKDWFPFDDSYDEDDKNDAENSFANTKLCLELGEYDRDDYEYLFWLRERCKNREEYDWAIGVFISALSEEYGWV